MIASKDSGNLAIQRCVSPDNNPFNPDRIQVSDSPRRTEDEAVQRLRRGALLEAPPPHRLVMNGQVVDTNTMLMCSKCCGWKKDKEFARDRTRIIRRGRRYYCNSCLKQMRH